MSKRQTNKMTAAQRRRHYLKRRLRWTLTLVTIVAALLAGSHYGVFGRRPAGDFEKYHRNTFTVVKIVDGDTIDIDTPDQTAGYKTTRVRLWGVDTPETKKANTPIQHFGPEATDFAKRTCMGKAVTLELDPSDTRGKHGRLLAYVHLGDGTMLNRRIVAEGYGYADPRFGHAHKAEFRRLQNAAQKNRIGLWANVTRQDLPYYYRDLKLDSR